MVSNCCFGRWAGKNKYLGDICLQQVEILLVPFWAIYLYLIERYRPLKVESVV